MLNDREGFVSLPGEQRLFTSPPRTSITLESLNKSSSGPQPFSVSCADGRVYLTTRRVSHSTYSSRLPNTAHTFLGRLHPHTSSRSSTTRRHRLPTSPPILRRTNNPPPRHTRHSALVRSQRSRRPRTARTQWRHTSNTTRHQADVDVPGRRRIRLPYQVHTSQRTASTGVRSERIGRA